MNVLVTIWIYLLAASIWAAKCPTEKAQNYCFVASGTDKSADPKEAFQSTLCAGPPCKIGKYNCESWNDPTDILDCIDSLVDKGLADSSTEILIFSAAHGNWRENQGWGGYNCGRFSNSNIVEHIAKLGKNGPRFGLIVNSCSQGELQRQYLELPKESQRKLCIVTSSGYGAASDSDWIEPHILESNNFLDLGKRVAMELGGTYSAFPYSTSGFKNFFAPKESKVPVPNFGITQQTCPFSQLFTRPEEAKHLDAMLYAMRKEKLKAFELIPKYYALTHSKLFKKCREVFIEKMLKKKPTEGNRPTGNNDYKTTKANGDLLQLKQDITPFYHLFNICSTSPLVVHNMKIENDQNNCKQYFKNFVLYSLEVNQLNDPTLKFHFARDYEKNMPRIIQYLSGLTHKNENSLSANDMWKFLIEANDQSDDLAYHQIVNFWSTLNTTIIQNFEDKLDAEDLVRRKACESFRLK